MLVGLKGKSTGLACRERQPLALNAATPSGQVYQTLTRLRLATSRVELHLEAVLAEEEAYFENNESNNW